MPDTADQRGLAELVGHCLHATKADQDRPLPIVLIWGPRESGKSELLDHLYERFYPGRPCVRLRQGELSDLRPHRVALRLASKGPGSRYGRLPEADHKARIDRS